MSLPGNAALTVVLSALGLAVLALVSPQLFTEAQAMPDWRSMDSVIGRYGPQIDARLNAEFVHKGLSYPPPRLAVLGLKHEKKMELWGAYGGQWKFIKSYPLKAASGIAGPKLQEGDRQVPEGFYRITKFNPNSNYHLSLKLNYPNAYDRERARLEGRERLGGDIYIHGNAKSIGCLAIGDTAIEELFVLVERVGLANTEVLIAPHDFRNRPFKRNSRYRPFWLPELYQDIEAAMAGFQR